MTYVYGVGAILLLRWLVIHWCTLPIKKHIRQQIENVSNAFMAGEDWQWYVEDAEHYRRIPTKELLRFCWRKKRRYTVEDGDSIWDEMHTYDEWKELGYQVRKGEKAVYENGIYLFNKGQVTPTKYKSSVRQ